MSVKNANIDMIESLRTEISGDEIRDMCRFIEELYMMDYDVLILMARKFFNLFCVFHEINIGRFARLEIPYNGSGKIITNRALPMIKEDIKSKKIKKIVIADDIIVHGRSIKEVYDEVLEINPELEVSIVSYVRNKQDQTMFKNMADHIFCRYLVENNEWRAISNKIVSTFLITGRPYISYLPYFSLNIQWNQLKEILADMDCIPLTDEDLRRLGIEAYIYQGKDLQIFHDLEFCKICAIRFYYYPQSKQVVLIPYFCMDLIEYDSLIRISDFLRKDFICCEYLKATKANHFTDIMRNMEVEYVLSSWMAMYFLNKHHILLDIWHKEIEKYNFSDYLLSEDIITTEEITKRIRDLSIIDKEVVKGHFSPDNRTNFLLEKFSGLKDLYKINYEKWKKANFWMDSQIDYGQMLIDNYLAENGNLDEDYCQTNEPEKKRLYGISVPNVLDQMQDYLFDLYNGEKSKEICMNLAFSYLILAVDSGRGTIVTKIDENNNQIVYNGSVIYAGEQNFRFYDYTNFPLLYGYYMIERETERQMELKDLKRRKREMTNRFMQYLDENNIFYIKEEVLQIERTNVCERYKKFLQDSFEKYKGNATLNKAISLAKNICNII